MPQVIFDIVPIEQRLEKTKRIQSTLWGVISLRDKFTVSFFRLFFCSPVKHFYYFSIFSVTVSPFFRKKQLSDNLLSVSSITYGIHVSAVISQPPSVSVKTKASFLPQGTFLK